MRTHTHIYIYVACKISSVICINTSKQTILQNEVELILAQNTLITGWVENSEMKWASNTYIPNGRTDTYPMLGTYRCLKEKYLWFMHPCSLKLLLFPSVTWYYSYVVIWDEGFKSDPKFYLNSSLLRIYINSRKRNSSSTHQPKDKMGLKLVMYNELNTSIDTSPSVMQNKVISLFTYNTSCHLKCQKPCQYL